MTIYMVYTMNEAISKNYFSIVKIKKTENEVEVYTITTSTISSEQTFIPEQKTYILQLLKNFKTKQIHF